MGNRRLRLSLFVLVALSIQCAPPAFTQTKPFTDNDRVQEPTEDAPAPTPDDRTDNRTEKLIRGWPFLYRDRGPGDREATDILFPFYHHERIGTRHSSRVAPFYFHARDEARRESWSLFLPLYYSSRDGESWRWSSLPVSFGHDSETNTDWWRSPAIFPLYRGSSTPEIRTDRFGLWPLIDVFAREGRPDGQSLDILGLASWRNPGEAWLPFLRYRSAYGKTREVGVFPFWHYRVEGSGEELNSRWWIPILGLWKSNSTTGSEAGWLPLLARYRDYPDSYSWSALLGAWSGGYDAEARWSRIEPFYSHEAGPGHGSTTILRLFGREWSNDRGHRATTILPPLGYFASDNYGYAHRFFPFYFAGGSTRDDLPTSSYRAILPFYYHYRSPRQERRLVFPLYYGAETTTTDESGADRTYGSRVGFPLYWHEWSPDSSSLHLFPIYSRMTNPSRDLSLLLGPLYVHRQEHRAGGSVDRSVMWPLFGYSRSKSHRHFHAVPLVWITRESDGNAIDLIAPFYLRVANQRRSHHWFLPAYGRYRDRDEDGTETSRDFYAGGALTRTVERKRGELNGQRSWHLLGPLAGVSTSDDGDEVHTRLLPFWWRTRSKEQSRTIALPLFYRERTGRGEQQSSFTLAAGNAWVDMRSPGRREFGLFYPLTRFRRSDELESDQVLFVFERTKKTPQAKPHSSRSRLTPFYYGSSGEEAASAHQWWHLWSHQQLRDSSRFRLMPFLATREETREGVQWDLFGGLIRRRDYPHRERLTWIAPLYLDYREGLASDPDRTLFTLFPFYYRGWRRSTEETTTSVLFPLFSHTSTKSGDSSRTSILWPLAERRRSEGYQSTRFFPLFDVQRWNTGERQWDLSLLYRSRHVAPGEEVGGLASRDGYLGLQLARSAAGDNTSTVVVQPFLFGYHRDDRVNLLHWQNLFIVNRYWRQGNNRSYSMLGLIHGGSDSDRSWHSTFPLYFSDTYEQTEAPLFSVPSAMHLFSRVEDANVSKWSLLGYLANGHRRKHGDDSEFRILYRGAAFIRRGTYRERVIQPLFNYENDSRTGESYFSLGKILYIQRRDSRLEGWNRYLLGIPLQW